MLMFKTFFGLRVVAVILLWIMCTSTFAQDTKSIVLKDDYNGLPLTQAISRIESSYNLHFIFKESWLQNLFVNKETTDLSLEDLLTDVVGSKGLTITYRGKNIILYQQDNIPFSLFATYAESKYGVSFIYREDWIEDFQVSKSFIGKDLRGALEQMLMGTLLKAAYRENSVIIYRTADIDQSDLSIAGKVDESVVIIGENQIATSPDQPVPVSGQVRDAKTGDELLGARIFVKQSRTGVVSNHYGFFTLDLTPGYYDIVFDFVGFERTTVKALVKGRGKLDVDMYESSILLNEVTVEELASSENVTTMDMGRNDLSIQAISKIPAFLGEVDAVKSFLTLPGVNTVGEGASGFNVRGGGTDQNLFLFDGVPVFNPSHLFGFFSSFNTDLVRKATLYKGSIPSQFGGRASSVLDVHTQDEVTNKLGVKGGIGLVYSRLMLEVPLVSEKSSIAIGGRKSYADWMLQRAQDIDVKQSKASFSDFNIKWNTALGDRDKLSFSYYNSNDSFKFAEDTVYRWSTNNYSIKWRHLFGKRWFGSVQGYRAGYSYGLDGQKQDFQFNLNSNVLLKAVNLQMTFVPRSGHTVSFGGVIKRYTFNPGKLIPTTNSQAVAVELAQESSREETLFVQDELQITPHLTSSVGFRFSRFSALGAGMAFQYENGKPRNIQNITDTINYSEGSVLKRYFGLEPRVTLKYVVNNSSSVKLSYNRMRQYVHTISSTVAISPIDIWKPSDQHLKPQTTDQVSLGYFRNFKEDKIETSLEVYYKRLENIIDYKNGAQVLLNEHIEQVLLNGHGRAYGVETFIKKNYGQFTGWVSYTYSRSERQFESAFSEEVINKGNYFPADYDRPHTLSLVANHQLTKRWSFGFNFTYSTGRPTTLPQAKFVVDGITFASFSNRNQHRIPDYHRLDFSITLDTGHKKKKLWNGSWTLALYNVYMRENAYSVFFRNEVGKPPSAFQLSVLGTIFPSLTYNLKFVDSKMKKVLK